MSNRLKKIRQEFIDYRLLRNQAFLLLWSSQAVSAIGDAFFNLAVMWVVYTESGSALQTAIIQVVWQLSPILIGPLAGALVDRWDRKKIMVLTNMLSAVVVGAVAVSISRQGQVTPVTIFVTVFLLNSLNSFLSPARFSIMPEIVSHDLLATAAGVSASTKQLAALLGNALAGVVIATVGTTWSLAIDAVSFLFASIAIIIAPLPRRTNILPAHEQRPSLLREIMDGWQAIMDLPLVQALVWLSVFMNASSFLGPLYPALISQRLHSGAAAYGTIEALGVIGTIAAGLLAGFLEKRLGAGRLLVAGWLFGGICVLGIAFSTSLVLTAVLEAALTFNLTAATIVSGVLMQTLVPENYRGRASGIIGGLSVITIPFTALIGGWFTDKVGVLPVFVFGGIWIITAAGLAWSNSHVRVIRINAI